MRTSKKRGAATEARPYASKSEVQQAVLAGHLAGLLQKKRVKLAVAEDALTSARRFLANTDDVKKAETLIPDGDPRIRLLARHVESERRRIRSAQSMLRDEKRIGQTVRYKVQRNGQRKTGFLHTPLSTLELETGSPLDEVDVQFLHDCIIIRRPSKEEAA